MTDDPLWYKDADHLSDARQGVPRRQRRRHRRLRRTDAASRLHPGARASTRSGCCRSIRRRMRDDGYDIADYSNVHPDYGTLEDFREFVDEAHRRGLKVITELVINHTSDQHPWFQTRAPRAARLARARVLRVERRRQEVRRHAHHLHRYRELELGLGSGRGPVLLAPLLLASARPQSQQSARSSKRSSRSCASGWTWASTACGSMRFRTCACARAPTTRTCRRRTRC